MGYPTNMGELNKLLTFIPEGVGGLFVNRSVRIAC